VVTLIGLFTAVASIVGTIIGVVIGATLGVVIQNLIDRGGMLVLVIL